MFCGSCGAANNDGSKYCASCGNAVGTAQTAIPSTSAPAPVKHAPTTDVAAPLSAPHIPPSVGVSAGIPVPSPLADMWRKSKGVRFSFIVLAVLLALGLIGKMVSPSGDKPSYGVSSSAPVPQKPPLDETTIYAYALLKDPYTHKKHRVDFSPMSWPIIFNGQVSQYTEDHTGARMYASYTGLRFERMMSNGIALYNIMGKTADSTSPDLEFMGQLAVQLPPSITSLDTNKFWEVEPLGVASGTNAFGREITIPIIKFWDYTEVRVAAMSKPGPLTGDSLAAVNLVKSKIRPTKVLLSKQPNFSDSEWMPVNNQMLCDGCWFITYHIRVKHTAYADYVSGDWKVNLKSQSVTPLPETHKYFDTM